MKRNPLSKSTRFEIFKRDGFRCVYCGATPVQKELRVDHIQPVAKGGTDDPSNLATACFDCNAGKAARQLDSQRFCPVDAEAASDRAAQIREFLDAQLEVEKAKQRVGDALKREWKKHLGEPTPEMKSRFPALGGKEPFDLLFHAIEITAKKYGKHEGSQNERNIDRQKYFYGVLRKLKETRGSP